jgi:lipoprotein-releasing system permease protein
MRVFVMVGAILGLTGALIGLLLGVTIILNLGDIENALRSVGIEIFPPDVYGLDGLPAELNWGEAIFTTLWAMSMSVLVTLWPAWSAAKLDPVEALRFE